MSLSRAVSLALHLLLGAAGGLVAAWAGLPIPFLLGALAAVAPLVIWQSARERPTLRFPKPLRLGFIAVIGTMIGASFSPETLAKVPTIWLSLIAVAAFVIVAHVIGYLIYRHVAGYDRPTALYGAMPGGLIEGVTLGEQAGGNPMLLTVHHFLRIVIVVVSVPLLFAVFSGEIVGSAAGMGLGAADSGLGDIALIAALSGVGFGLARLARIPAGHLMGPLIFAALLHGLGAVDITSPGWLLALAQLVVGTALGTQFAGATPKLLAKACGYTFLAVGLMLALSALVAVALTRFTVMSFDAAFISFAPGGVAEMGLIALSLEASPVLVAVHHLVRIMLTVVFVRLADRWLVGDSG